MWQKIKDFIAEYEILTSAVFFSVVLFSYPLINKVFYTVPDSQKTNPGFDAFYYAAQTLLIWAGFWLVVILWTKYNFPEVVKAIKKPAELDYRHAFIFLSLIFASLVATGIMVYP